MLYAKDHKTEYIFDPFEFLGPQRRRLLDKSWAKFFRDEILSELPVDKLQTYYHDTIGRPSKELYALMGTTLLQQMHDLTDEETVEQFAFNIKWHYALNITSDSDSSSYICLKTLWAMRKIMTENDLYSPLFENVTKKIENLFPVNCDKQRQDSVHICSNMRHLGRIGLFVRVIKKFLTNLKRHHNQLFAALSKELTARYLSKSQEAVFSMVKPSQSGKTLVALSADLFFLSEKFKNNDQVAKMNSYQLLLRLLKEQCIVEDDISSTGQKVSVKPNKDIASDSLQNPSDPDATYDGHKGQGYQVQVMETYSPDPEDKQLSLFTHVAIQPAHESDTQALIPAIEDTQKRDLGPQEVLADSLYGHDENCQKAQKMGVNVVSPLMGKPPQKGLSLTDFSFSKDGKVITCPAGLAPVSCNRRKNHSATFDSQICGNCQQLKDCPVKAGRKAHSLHYSKKDIRIAQRRANEKTSQFRDKYRFRAGIEATMSYFDRKTGVKHLRVRGLAAVSFCVTLKAAAVNILRAVAFKNRQTDGKTSPGAIKSAFFSLFRAIKEQFLSELNNFQNIYKQFIFNCQFEKKFV